MAKLTRFTMPVFAGNAAQTQTSVFGTMKTSPQYTSDVAASIGTTAYGNGWADAIEIGYAPYMEDMNTLQKAITYQISYGQQQGIPEWASDTEYYKGSLAKLNTANGSQIYSSLVDNNVGNLLSDATKWKLVLDTANTYVTTNTAQTITGAKTFTSDVKVSKSSPLVDLYNTNITKGTDPSSLQIGRNAMCDKDGKYIAMTQYQYLTDGRIEAILRAYNPKSETSYAQIGVAYKTDGTVFTAAPRPTDTTTTSGTQIATTGWVNSVGNNVVHKSADETIGGTKTFTSAPFIKKASAHLYMDDTNQKKGTAPSADAWSSVTFHDANGNLMGRCRQLYAADKSNKVELQVHKANSSSDTDSSTMGIKYPANGSAYGFAPNSDVNGSILTTVNKSKSSNGYFKLGNGMIVQWGKTGNLNNNASSPTSTTFPTPFASSNYKVILTVDNGTTVNNEYGLYVVSKTTTAFTAIIRGYEGGALNKPAAYIAIGY